jgi:uncharacterized membrane protein
LSVGSLLGLLFLCLAWELWLAPLRPGGSYLALKALPLLFPLLGILKGRVYTYRWAIVLVLAYFTEGVIRAWSERGASAWLGGLEIVLALTFFFSAAFYARGTGRTERKGVI